LLVSTFVISKDTKTSQTAGRKNCGREIPSACASGQALGRWLRMTVLCVGAGSYVLADKRSCHQIKFKLLNKPDSGKAAR